MKIIKDDFLNDEAVSGFIKYLAKLINGNENSFKHVYTNKRNDEKWQCDSLRDAFQKYYWGGKNFSETNNELDTYKEELRESYAKFETDGYDPSNEIKFMKACKKILKWGGVLTKNTEWMVDKICSKKGVIHAFVETKKLLEETIEFNKEDWEKNSSPNRMNAGYTKIYSLLCDDFIIYDSRVAAALGKIIHNYLDQEIHSFKELPDNLKIGLLEARKNKGKSNIRTLEGFPNISGNGAKHAEWNVKANWILKAAIEKADFHWKDNAGNTIEAKDRLRALETALFMIGYDLSGI